MRRFIVLLLPLGALALICPQGYIDDGAGNCQSPKQIANSQFAAQTFCANSNAYLPIIRNAIENSALGGSSENLWLGLTCTNSSKNSCSWANGLKITDSVYTNFAPNNPNATTGGCVYFNSTNYMWYSSSCYIDQKKYYCRYTPGIDVPLCFGYTGNNNFLMGLPAPINYFEGNCYFQLGTINSYNEGRSKCELLNAELVSIHNEAENSIVRDFYASPSYSILALGMDAGVWDDNSTLDYSNFENPNPTLGNCTYMQLDVSLLSPPVASVGKWINGDCQMKSFAICKRPLPQVATNCGQTNYLTGHGQIHSPILGTTPVQCKYVISQPNGYGISLSIPVGNELIMLYNDVFGLQSIPRGDAGNMYPSYFKKLFYSTGNVMYAIITWQGSPNTTTQFIAEYNVRKGLTNNCGGVYGAPGIISGPEYAANCTYKIAFPKVCAHFIGDIMSTIGPQYGDFFSVYDGSVSPDNQIGLYSSEYRISASYVNLCSSTGFLYIVTNGTSGQDYPMFMLSAYIRGDVSIYSPLGLQSRNETIVQAPYTLNLTTPMIYTVNLVQQVEFESMNVPSPAFIILLDGNANSTIALAYGISNAFPRKVFKRSQYQSQMTIVPNAYTPMSFVAQFV